jgi:L-ribulose-5-phosphate 3-epimerase
MKQGNLSARVSRRSMLRQSARAAALVALAANYAPLFASSSNRRFKIGACDWSIGKAADVGAFDVARQIGLDGVQVSFGTATDETYLGRPDVQHQYHTAAQRTGVEIASLAIGGLSDVPYKTDARAEIWVSDCVDVLQALKVKVVLLAFFGKGDLTNDQKGTAEVIRRLKKVAPKAEKAGVILGLESWLSAEDTLRVMDGVGSKAVKMYYDVRNSIQRGYDIYKEIRLLGKDRICEFHMKENDCLLGKGPVNFEKVRDAINDIGYEGWMQIESALPPKSEIVECYITNLRLLRGLFAG